MASMKSAEVGSTVWYVMKYVAPTPVSLSRMLTADP